MAAKKLKEPKRSPGQPTKYKPEYCQLLIEHMKEGFSLESFAAKVDTCRDTLYHWRDAHSEFFYAIKKGQAASLLWWESIGRAGATGKLPGFQTGAWIFTMKNRHGYADVTISKVEDNRVSEAKELVEEMQKVLARKNGIK